MNTFRKLQSSFALSVGLVVASSASMAADDKDPKAGAAKTDIQAMISSLASEQETEEFIIPISGPILPVTQPLAPSGSADLVRAFLKRHDKETPNKPIVMEINSPGGEWTTLKTILQAMAQSKTPVNTRCTGLAASAGGFILMSGKLREAWGSCQIVLHNVQLKEPASEGGQISAVDKIEQNRREIVDLESSIADGKKILMRSTGLDGEMAGWILARDCLMPLDAAKALHVIDKINDPFDHDVNTRKFIPAATNICLGYTMPDDILKKVKDFVAKPYMPR